MAKKIGERAVWLPKSTIELAVAAAEETGRTTAGYFDHCVVRTVEADIARGDLPKKFLPKIDDE